MKLKIGNFFILFFLLFPLANAMSYQSGDVNYNFDYDIENVIPFENGILINDDIEFQIANEGGKINIIFYNESFFGIYSNVPQPIYFKIASNEYDYYLSNNESNFFDSINIKNDELLFNIVEQKSTNVSDNDNFTKLKWYQKKVFEFEYYSNLEENGMVEGKNFSITYLFLYIMAGLIFGGFVIWLIKR